KRREAQHFLYVSSAVSAQSRAAKERIYPRRFLFLRPIIYRTPGSLPVTQPRPRRSAPGTAPPRYRQRPALTSGKTAYPLLCLQTDLNFVQKNNSTFTPP